MEVRTTYQGNVLLVDDEQDVCDLLGARLRAEGFTVHACLRPMDALAALGQQSFDAVVTDMQMAIMDGAALCERVHEIEPDLPVIFVTAYAVLDAAVSAMRAGAYDFVSKPVDMTLLCSTLNRAIERRRLRSEVKRLKDAVTQARGFDRLIGKSAAMTQVFEAISRVAATPVTVFVQGESGTGKELVARALHDNSDRASGPFVAINCAAVPPTLIESELFGHAKGAFTDAKGARRGLFLDANGGTLFLDEIGEMPMDMQPKLLRALQERVVRPVGGSTEMPFDARIIVATNRDLEGMVQDGRFREDLYYRINVVSVEVPPLRARSRDVLLLAQHFVERFAERLAKNVTGIDASAAAKLLAYDWPGNVRELENCIERAVTLTRFEQIAVDDLTERVRTFRKGGGVLMPTNLEELVPLEVLEQRYLEHVLRLVNGNKSKAAKILGYDRRTLYRRMERQAEAEAAARAESNAPVADGAVSTSRTPVNLRSPESGKSEPPLSGALAEHTPIGVSLPASEPATSTSVLIVENDDDLRDLLEMGLRAEGYQVLVADCVQAALAQNKVDVVVTDIALPDGSGKDVAKAMSHVPVIAMSGHSEPSAGSVFKAWLVKPVSLQRLTQQIHDALAEA